MTAAAASNLNMRFEPYPASIVAGSVKRLTKQPLVLMALEASEINQGISS